MELQVTLRHCRLNNMYDHTSVKALEGVKQMKDKTFNTHIQRLAHLMV